MQGFRIIVTGISRGLGKDLLRVILKKHPEYQVIATARSGLPELKSALDQEFPNNRARLLPLDLSKPDSIHQFVHQLTHNNDTFDCLINNAAYGADYGEVVPSVQTAVSTLESNVFGTVQLTEQLLPLLREGGRIVNVSSKMGGLVYHGKEVVDRFSNNSISYEEIVQQAKKYIEGCKKGDVGQYYKSVYGTSKMMLNAWSRFILKHKLKPGQTTIAMSPGHCMTDMGGKAATRTSLDGAQSIYHYIHGNYSPDKFYHVYNETDFTTCG